LIKTGDYPDIEKKLQNLGLNFPKSLALLPENLADAKEKKDLLNSATTPTVRVLLRQAGIVETPIEEENHIPRQYLESFDWFGPTIFLASTLISQNPEIVDKIISLIMEYLLKVFFRGIPKNKRNAKLHIVVQTKKGSFKKADYEGDAEGLKELPRIIRSLNDEQ
jgi:hypothetical protein